MRTVAVTIAQVAGLLAINNTGYAVAGALRLPLPGNLLGMLLLLGLIASGVVPLRWVEGSAALLIRHLGFFFVPITVGLMGAGELFASNGTAILTILIVSAAMGIGAAGLSSQRLAAWRGRRVAR